MTVTLSLYNSLAPFDLKYLNNLYDGAICFASSAMEDLVSRGCLRGRPFGGVAMFLKNRLADVTRLVTASTRYIIVQVGQVVLIHDLRMVINDFACELDLQFVDDMLPINNRTTYRVTTTGAKSTIIDHFAVSNSIYSAAVNGVKVIDSGVNLSDHCPLILSITMPELVRMHHLTVTDKKRHDQSVYRWDLGDTVQYYKLAGEVLSEINVPMHLLAEESPCDGSCLNAKGHTNLYYDSIVC